MNAYMLTLAAFVAVGGQLSDLFDRRGPLASAERHRLQGTKWSSRIL